VIDAPVPVVIALGSNLGPRELHLRRAVDRLQRLMRVVRLSSVHETEALDSPSGAGRFLNMVLLGYTRDSAPALLQDLLNLEIAMGRRRPAPANSPRPIDLDLILYGALISRGGLQVPHPRYRQREFVLAPLRELKLPWMDPVTGYPLGK
jgi:2-amino-4-hydroxy-6-hydroxymethyldihydropteridine diphosphokinase